MAFKLPMAKQPTTAQNDGASRTSLAGKVAASRRLRVLGGALITFLLLVVVAAYFDNRAAAQGTRYIAESSRLQMLSQRSGC